MRQFKKVIRDLWFTRGRVAFMVLSLSVGLSSLGAVLSMRGVLQREMTRNYLDTVPASATFDLGEQGVSDAVLEQVRALPEIAVAERRSTLAARWRADDTRDWGRALLFVAEDIEKQQLALLEHESGASSALRGSVLVERSAMRVLEAVVGDSVEVSVAGGPPIRLKIAGVVHEPALAPAVTEQAAYLYASVETLALLGQSPVLDELRVLVANHPLDLVSVENQVRKVATYLIKQGQTIHEIQLPPPGEHPHQAPSDAVLTLLAVFAALTILLAGVLSASLLAITMARQVREIAIMKTLGSVGRKIRLQYAFMLVLISFGAILLSALPTRVLGRLGIDAIASLLNFDIASYQVPHWAYAIQIAAGLIIPLLTAAPGIIYASRVSVRRAMDEHGARVPRRTGAQRWIGFFDNRLLRAALRNAFRVPRRLALTLGLLAVGGGLFIGAVSVADAWGEMTYQVFETRHYDVEIRLAKAARSVDTFAGVEHSEVWGSAPVTMATESGLPVSRTYPDGGHGSFHLVAVPDNTRLVEFKQLSGRWLEPGESDGVVINQLAAARMEPDPVGRYIDLVVEGRLEAWKVVGVVEEVAAPATAYVGAGAFQKKTGQELRLLRVATDVFRDAVATPVAIRDVQRQLGERGDRIVSVVPLQLLFNAMGEHVVVLVRLLGGLALLMAIVGVLALGSSMSTSVVERTRELGVLQAIGARPNQVRGMVLMEGLFVALLSLPLALLMAAPVAVVIGRIVGQLAFLIPLPLNLSWISLAGWAIGVLLISSLASLVPATGATKRTVREALSHV